jgi:hypothetical protein
MDAEADRIKAAFNLNIVDEWLCACRDAKHYINPSQYLDYAGQEVDHLDHQYVTDLPGVPPPFLPPTPAVPIPVPGAPVSARPDVPIKLTIDEAKKAIAEVEAAEVQQADKKMEQYWAAFFLRRGKAFRNRTSISAEGKDPQVHQSREACMAETEIQSWKASSKSCRAEASTPAQQA